MMECNAANYQKGFFLDEDCLGGILQSSSQYVLFVVQYTTGQYLRYESFDTFVLALEAIQKIPRNWTFQLIHACQKQCQSGQCKGGCHKKPS